MNENIMKVKMNENDLQISANDLLMLCIINNSQNIEINT